MRRDWLVRTVATVVVVLGALPGTAAASGSSLGPPPLPTTQPFQQCAAVYQDPSCGYLIDITNSGNRVLVDPSIGYYEGQDDILVGVQNDSGGSIGSVHIGVAGSGYGSFGFDGDGLCKPGGGPVPADCPFGPIGDPGDYWGPDAQLTADSGTTDSGTVTFPTPLRPGQYTYFSLESPFSGATVITGNQNDVVSTSINFQGPRFSAPSSQDVTDTATIAPFSINGSSATGHVDFSVYSDPACTQLVASSPGVTLTSASATATIFASVLPTNATYYVQANYSGDINFSATSTNCGDETITFGTPPKRPPAAITTILAAANGTRGARISVPTGTPVRDTVSVKSAGGGAANGRVSYYVYSDASCSTQVPGVNLGSGVSSNGVYPPSAPAALGNGTYYFQAIYSGNSNFAGGRSPCTEVLTVAPPCKCAKLSAYLNKFHVFGADSTRLEFNFHSAITCAIGVGGCSGTIQVTAPGSARFIDSRGARNGARGVKLKKKTATLTFLCGGRCAVRTVQSAFTLQWLAFIKVKTQIKRNGKTVTIKKTIPDPLFTPQGRANRVINVTLLTSCNGVVKVVVLKIHFDKLGQVDYKKSDLNGDGKRDGGELKDRTGFV